jgi:dienelactone hydrolase
MLTTDHLDDVMAGLAVLKKSVTNVDASRMAIGGHSFGGQLALLAAERDSTLRAAVTFAPAAIAWSTSADLRARLLKAVSNITMPMFFTYAANDHSTTAGEAFAAELTRLNRPFQLKIYPAVGDTPGAGHNAVHTDNATWEGDVFRFLDANLKKP